MLKKEQDKNAFWVKVQFFFKMHRKATCTAQLFHYTLIYCPLLHASTKSEILANMATFFLRSNSECRADTSPKTKITLIFLCNTLRSNAKFFRIARFFAKCKIHANCKVFTNENIRKNKSIISVFRQRHTPKYLWRHTARCPKLHSMRRITLLQQMIFSEEVHAVLIKENRTTDFNSFIHFSDMPTEGHSTQFKSFRQGIFRILKTA